VHKARYFGDVSPDEDIIRPIEILPKKIVLDTNILLFAIFFKNSPAIIFSDLKSKGYDFYISSETLNECEITLQKYSDDIGMHMSIVNKFILFNNISVIYSNNLIDGVNKSDRHLASSAIEVGGFVVSDDTPLLLQLDKCKIHARSLREVIASSDDEIQYPLYFRGTGLGADGHIIIKATFCPSFLVSWHNNFTLFSLDGLGELSYNGKFRRFEFDQFGSSKKIYLDFEIIRGEIFTVLVNYSVGTNTTITLKARHLSGDSFSTTCVVSQISGVPDSSLLDYFSGKDNKQWPGYYLMISHGPYCLSRESWNSCSKLVGVGPPTLTSGLLLGAVVFSRLDNEMIRRIPWDGALILARLSASGLYPGKRHKELPPEWHEVSDARDKKMADDYLFSLRK